MAAVAELARIRGQLERLHALCGNARLADVNERVSKWSPAEHVDHLLKVTGSVLKRVPSSEDVGNGISLLGRAVLALGWIPRGRGKAPERLAGTRATADELRASVDRVRGHLDAIDAASVDGTRVRNVPHPRFGGLTPAQALRFVSVHNEHHLKIVAEILG